MILVLDIGNTHTHVGLADGRRVHRHLDMPTAAWFTAGRGSVRPPNKDGLVSRRPRSQAGEILVRFVSSAVLEGAALCSVVPRATPLVRRTIRSIWRCAALELNSRTIRGVGIDYPRPNTIGPDRLANAVAARRHYGVPAIVIDFGTAVTFDVVDRHGNYVGGIIAPGLATMTDYLHEKTALLPRIRMQEIDTLIGRSTREAMLIGAVHGYRGLIRELLLELRRALCRRRVPVVATGGYASLLAAKLPEIQAVEPLLTLEGLRLVWEATPESARRRCGPSASAAPR